jgi:hypothetical protein|tara:strand:- start:138 stop:743 length:606 start_codon:yes stop_codon:yes gene_type:complete
MAWDFAAEISALTGFNADYNVDSPTGETFQVHATQWLTDSAKEVIKVMPQRLLHFCSSNVSFTSGSASTLNTGKILTVFRSDGDIQQPCRKIEPFHKGRYSDGEDMNVATVTDPVYFVENNTLDVLPVGGSCTYSEVQFPAVSYNNTAISTFPDEAERAVVVCAAIKAAEYLLANEEDTELMVPVINALKEDYQRELGGLQ